PGSPACDKPRAPVTGPENAAQFTTLDITTSLHRHPAVSVSPPTKCPNGKVEGWFIAVQHEP
ncbi:MAG: hypothetical protein AAFR52_09655, partial [Pseudomonadota bacterium]